MDALKKAEEAKRQSEAAAKIEPRESPRQAAVQPKPIHADCPNCPRVSNCSITNSIRLPQPSLNPLQRPRRRPNRQNSRRQKPRNASVPPRRMYSWPSSRRRTATCSLSAAWQHFWPRSASVAGCGGKCGRRAASALPRSPPAPRRSRLRPLRQHPLLPRCRQHLLLPRQPNLQQLPLRG